MGGELFVCDEEGIRVILFSNVGFILLAGCIFIRTGYWDRRLYIALQVLSSYGATFFLLHQYEGMILKSKCLSLIHSVGICFWFLRTIMVKLLAQTVFLPDSPTPLTPSIN